MWINKPFPTIHGYESHVDRPKRFLDFKPNQLLDTADPVWETKSSVRSIEDIQDYVIYNVDYPFHNGKPDDVHIMDWFRGKCKHVIRSDYWQQASETLLTVRLNNGVGFGDCEDSSILFSTLMLSRRYEVYEVLGFVAEKDGDIIGGHGWSIFKDDDGLWKLFEATLSEAPNECPVIDISECKWEFNGVVYQGLAMFDRRNYYEAHETSSLEIYLSYDFAAKEKRAKYDRLSKAWMINTKPMDKVNLLSKLRWK